MARRNSIHLCRQDRILNVFLYVFLAIFLILCAYPVYFVLIASFSNATVVNSGKLMLWPEGFHLLGYKFVFSDVRILTGYKNTLIYTVGGTVLGLFVSLLAGYSLSRSDLPGRKVLMALMVFTMYFGGGLIPTYITIKNMGLVDTRALMIILGSVSVYNIILIRTFFQSNLPTELQEAAFIDGCTNTRFFFQFALPLSSAIIAVIALYLAVGYWNSYFNALIYINSNAKKPLTLFIRELLLSQENNEVADGELASDFKRMAQVVKYAVIVVATAPIMCMYPFLQKYFVKGVMIGSIKG